jgi:teichoic acid transport system ATP-binding protein
MKSIETGTYRERDEVTVHFKQRLNLRPGAYALSLGCVNIGEEGIEVYNRLYDCIFFEIIGGAEMVGFFDLESEVDIER